MGAFTAHDVAVLYNSLLVLDHTDNMCVGVLREDNLICNLLNGSRLYKKLDGASKTEASLEVAKTCQLSFGQQGPPRAGAKIAILFFRFLELMVKL